jgi:cobalt-zinc-cadmium efflux system membrane fusion protein
VLEVLANLGDKVAKGAPLAIIDSPDLGQAKSDVDKAQADLTAADHDLARQKELVEAQAGSRAQLEQSEDNQQKARAELERARERLKLLHGDDGQGSGERFVLRAPIAGEVIARNLNPGIEVSGQYGNGSAVELFTVGSIDTVWVWADLFEMDSAAVQKGAALSAQVAAYPKREFTGRVDWISPTLDPTTRTARVRCVLQNPRGELKPEMYATVKIATGERRALAIPRSAVLRIGEQTLVFVQSGKTESGLVKFQKRQVHVDENAAGDLLPVTDGLQRGDVVVITGGLQLTNMT